MSTPFFSFCNLFSKTAKENPNEKAVIFNQQALTYSQLDVISTNFANVLVQKDVKDGDVVALGMYNDLDLVISLFGIWKANGTYLPIDPNYPTERIQRMLEDSQPKLLITKKDSLDKFNFFEDEILLVNNLQKNICKNRTICKAAHPEQLAYIMYTSGSTGKPKGILVDQFALKHAALAYKELHPNKFVSLVSGSISFDPSLLVIIHTLTTGGTICLFDNKSGIDIKNQKEVINLINKLSISFILSTPSFYTKIINENFPLLSLKNVDLCGEPVSKDLMDKHLKIAPNATLCNAYGPTEYAIGVTVGVLYDSKSKKVFQVSIGKSFSCNKIYVLDSDFNKVKPGEKGEIFVGGPGLAKGYLNLESLNKERFLWISNLQQAPIRLYRTGDFGYYLPDDSIVFVGRSDSQIKINGHRVEIEEIEHVIKECPNIDQAVVTVKDCSHSGKHLIAYFSSSQKSIVSILKNHLSKKLPSYMQPSNYIRINTWPITKNGKIDRQVLASRAFRNSSFHDLSNTVESA